MIKYLFLLAISVIIIVLIVGICRTKKSTNENIGYGLYQQFIESFANKMFNLNTNDMVLLKNNKDICVIKQYDLVIYFYSNFIYCDNVMYDKYVHEHRKQYANTILCIIDGEPNDLSEFTHIQSNDIIITSKKDKTLLPKNIPNNTFYFPYLSMYMEFISPFVKWDDCLSKNISHNDKTEFCIFAYSNCDEKFDGVMARRKFLEILQKVSNNRVSNKGRCYASDKNLQTILPAQFNNDFFKPYKFVIAFENSNILGYNTEKIVNPILSGSIPIYYGNLDGNEYINRERLICVEDFPSFESCANYVLEVDNNDELFNEIVNRPFFIDDKIPDQLQFKYFYKEIFNMNRTNVQLFKLNYFHQTSVKFLTFADQTIYKYDRIIEEARKSNFFTECNGLCLKDLDDEFLKKHENWIFQNKRGYGYWIWKPQCIYSELKKLKENDILFYADSGCKIMNQRGEKIVEYINAVSKDKVGILGFKIKYNSIEYTKRDVLDKIIPDEQRKKFENKKQIAGGILVIRKNQKSMDIIKEWVDLSSDHHNIDDSPSLKKNDKKFKEHRHDQSILDCLFYKYSLKESDDNYEDDYSPVVCKGAIVPTRIK